MSTRSAPADRVVCAAFCWPTVVINAVSVAGIGEAEEAIAAPTEMTVARVSVPATATVIAFVRLVEKNEGRGICLAKTKNP